MRINAPVALAAVFVGAVLILARGPLGAPPKQLSTAAAQPAPSIYEAAVAATVSIEIDERVIGTGFVVDRGGTKYVWTAGHVVPSPEVCPECDVVHKMRISKPIEHEGVQVGRAFAEVEVVKDDDVWDIALLKITTPFPVGSVRFSSVLDMRLGDPIFTVGHAAGINYEYSLFFGNISRFNDSAPPLWVRHLTRANITVMGGCSGGPVFDQDGSVVGIVVGGSTRTDSIMLFVPLKDIDLWSRENAVRFALYQELW